MALSETVRLRLLLGESIPAGSTQADTMFMDAQLQDFLDRNGGDLNKAALAGWKAKAAEFANLVTVSEGNSARHMSDLHKNALAQIELYTGLTTTPVQGRGNVVIGTITR